MHSKYAPNAIPWSAPGDAQQSSASVIAVGEPSEWLSQGSSLPSAGMVFVSFHDVSETLLTQYRPQMIVSPALASGFDCIELALLLQTIGYTGAYCAVAKDIPNPGLVEREVAHICPGLNFRIVNAS